MITIENDYGYGFLKITDDSFNQERIPILEKFLVNANIVNIHDYQLTVNTTEILGTGEMILVPQKVPVELEDIFKIVTEMCNDEEFKEAICDNKMSFKLEVLANI